MALKRGERSIEQLEARRTRLGAIEQMSISGAVNGTDERLDVLIALFEQLLAELRQARLGEDAPAPPAKRTRKGQ